MSPDPAASQLCPPPSIVPRSSWEVLDAGSRSPLGKEDVGRVRSRLRSSDWVLRSGFRSPTYPAFFTLHPSIPGSPTAPAGRPAPVRSPPYPAPPHPQSREIGKHGVE